MINDTKPFFRHVLSAGAKRSVRALVFLVAFLAGALFSRSTEAQVADSAQELQRTWVSFGYGLAALAGADADEAYSLVGELGLHLQRGRYVGSLRAAVLFGIFGDTGFGDISLLLGRATRARGFRASASIGLAYVGGTDPVTYAGVATVGVPLEGQLLYSPGALGLGLYGFANLNPERSFAGLTLSLHVGALR